jgi:VWFA-related protein
VDVAVSRKGRAILGLTAEAFEVRDNGVVQDVELVSAGEMPLSVVLVLDTSASVAGEKLKRLRGAAGALLDGLAPGDLAALITFSQMVRVRSPLTHDIASVRARIGETSATGMTAVNDALYVGLGLLQGRRERSVMVLFTDGADNISWLSDSQVATLAREADPVIYAVATIPERSDAGVRVTGSQYSYSPGRMGFTSTPAAVRLPDYREALLRRLTDPTGGRLFVSRRSELTPTFLEVLAEMRTRYLLRYTPRGVDAAGWHRLEIRVPGRRAEVRARHGYLRAASRAPAAP